eukprot:CAMPEP_0180651948 /NCGR_PEP_ID=MMETSP1037_2-20121125/53202_1 /TAXON_ID=632150 /ORGANISM="Azadinium spinosum, Strain 3D9" /LENGTH=48 /DNA_ID= /DNA_START= /DNA_END= /DNA_ORIENTATION=
MADLCFCQALRENDDELAAWLAKDAPSSRTRWGLSSNCKDDLMSASLR